jgi:hypothetical protein
MFSLAELIPPPLFKSSPASSLLCMSDLLLLGGSGVLLAHPSVVLLPLIFVVAFLSSGIIAPLLLTTQCRHTLKTASIGSDRSSRGDGEGGGPGLRAARVYGPERCVQSGTAQVCW